LARPRSAARGYFHRTPRKPALVRPPASGPPGACRGGRRTPARTRPSGTECPLGARATTVLATPPRLIDSTERSESVLLRLPHEDCDWWRPARPRQHGGAPPNPLAAPRRSPT